VSSPNVTTGKLYRFYIVSENFVGLSLSASLISNFYACDYPKNLVAPTKVGVT